MNNKAAITLQCKLNGKLIATLFFNPYCKKIKQIVVLFEDMAKSFLKPMLTHCHIKHLVAMSNIGQQDGIMNKAAICLQCKSNGKLKAAFLFIPCSCLI